MHRTHKLLDIVSLLCVSFLGTLQVIASIKTVSLLYLVVDKVLFILLRLLLLLWLRVAWGIIHYLVRLNELQVVH